MSTSLTLVVVMAVLYAAGVYVLLERSLTRVLIGLLLIGNATNLLILIMSGRAGNAPIVEDGVDPATFADPLPQALILTAIVINFGVTAFLLALLYRSWWLARLGDQGDTLVRERQFGWATCVWVNEMKDGKLTGFYPMTFFIREEKIVAVNNGPDDAGLVASRYAREQCSQLGG